MSLCFRPLPEDDSIEADILAVTGPESQPGKNLTLRNRLLSVVFLFNTLCQDIQFLFHHRVPKGKLTVQESIFGMLWNTLQKHTLGF